jgi:hypothetical protein
MVAQVCGYQKKFVLAIRFIEGEHFGKRWLVREAEVTSARS